MTRSPITRLEDMSEPERQSWITFLADGAVFIYLWKASTQGLSPRLIHTDMEAFGEIIIGVIIVTVILHAVIASIFDMRKRKEAFEKDERDIRIEQQGAHWGYRLLQCGLGVIIVTMFLHNSVSGYAPPLSLQTPAEIIFALMVVSYVADLVKHGVMLHRYRTS